MPSKPDARRRLAVAERGLADSVVLTVCSAPEGGMAQVDLTSEDLVRLARAGDATAARVLFERHQALLRPLVRRRIGKRLRRRVGESDVLQSAYVVAIERCADFEDRGPGSFARWLHGIVENKLLHTHRRHSAKKRDATREVANDPGSRHLGLVAQVDSPSGAAAREEERGNVLRLVDSLPDSYRLVVRLVHDRGLTLVETAERLGRSPDAVRKLYGRAMARLAASWEKRGGTQ